MARGKKEKAREACDLLLLSLYCHIPPGRGLEVRTLEIIQEAELLEPFVGARFRNRNIALLQKDGGLTIHVQKYKTYPSAGKDTIAIQVRLLLPHTPRRIANCLPCIVTTPPPPASGPSHDQRPRTDKLEKNLNIQANVSESCKDQDKVLFFK